MLTYLLDASAATDIYVPRDERIRRVLQYILEQRNTFRQATLFIPNFCIAEVFNSFARMHFSRDGQNQALTPEEYKKCLQTFRSHIHWGRVLYSYDLNRYHIIASDTIFPAEHRLPRRYEHDHLSTFDILIIAMACELAYTGDPDGTFLVTCDSRLKQVFEDLKKSDISGFMIPGPLGELDQKRWSPPSCLFLPGLKKGELKHVSGQSQLNI